MMIPAISLEWRVTKFNPAQWRTYHNLYAVIIVATAVVAVESTMLADVREMYILECIP